MPAVAEPEVIHTVLALLKGCERIALHSTSRPPCTDAASGHVKQSVDLSAYSRPAGQQATVTFTATGDTYLQTGFVIDDVALQGGS